MQVNGIDTGGTTDCKNSVGQPAGATDIKTIQKDLQDLKYSASPFRLDHLIAKVNARKSAFNKDIIVITDAVGLEKNQSDVREIDSFKLKAPPC